MARKDLMLNILWIHQPCHVLEFNLKRCRTWIPICEKVYSQL
jgi:hypothetical protein